MLNAHIELILLFTGLLTAGALGLLLAPAPVLRLLFGQDPPNALVLLIARQWGLLVFLIGALLVWAAYHAEVRVPAMILACIEKSVFALSVLLSPFRRRALALQVALADAVMATLYLLILVGL
jgi:hypothetical protein